MVCAVCGKRYRAAAGKCPHCAGDANAGGTYQASTVMISSGGNRQVYRSVDEVPAPLRTQLLKSTNGTNSATILIADRGGRQQIARAMRSLPGGAQRRLIQAVMGEEALPGPVGWLTPGRRRALLVALALGTLAAVGFVFTRMG